MSERRQPIPLLLKLKRAKNSPLAQSLNDLVSYIKPSKKLKFLPKRILLIRNDKIGDAVVTLPVIRDLKLNYPEIEIDILASSRNKFIFEGYNYINNVINFDWTPEKLSFIYRLPFVGRFLQVLRFYFFPRLFSSSFKEKIKFLKSRRYDAVIDLVGLKRNVILGRAISKFIAGPRLFGAYFLYDHYMNSNWVTANDTITMSEKIDKVLHDSLGIEFSKRNTELPLVGDKQEPSQHREYDLILHLGTSQLRKFSPVKEKELIERFVSRKILITDSHETVNYKQLKEQFSPHENIVFKIFSSLEYLALECLNARVLLCYDGGQAHYLSQFIRTVAIFGPGAVELWKPYEFSSYCLLEEDINRTKAIISGGPHKHIAIYYPIWCSPCFDIGCASRPCLGEIKVEFISMILNKYCLE